LPGIAISSYSKTSYLPDNLVATDQTPASELLYIYQVQTKEIERLNLKSEHQQKIIDALTTEIEHLRAVNQGQREAQFGRSSEQQALSELEEASLEQQEQVSSDQTIPIPSSRRRGGRPGHKGYGRKIPDLPEIEVIHEVPKDLDHCSCCGKPYTTTGLTEDSNEYDIEIKLVRKKHRRKRMVRACDCPEPKFVTAPKPPQVIPKGKFSHAFLAHVILMKYYFQIPLHRLLDMLQMRGLPVTESTLIDNFHTLLTLFTPLYKRLVQINQSADHWHVDETGWKVFAHTEQKKNFNWWLWVFACRQTAVYLVDASRSASVLLKHFEKVASGIVSSDRYSAYTKLIRRIKGLKNAFCWAHFRRDFIKAAKENIRLKSWAHGWLTLIRELYRLNRRRLAALEDAAALSEAQANLDQEVERFRQRIEQELASPDLTPKQRMILKNARKNWEALTIFVKRAHVPMDNNRALSPRKYNPQDVQKTLVTSGISA
jgi:transposase